mmetsp:Transcript_7457/g.21062  ORF Transcript_7457/g.21062 Transcript_7457/m.21062 type:complete len:354 (-) Transcript_7457:258-1319(-)|eukprot:CAMPEP_0117669794 /NCGR_PEP_ID=MMETSP0804-20121206/12349_1 /TAXON_ID=1074897 /ORGANISM="Tetraselmis astigmatica, Strain CCMP880" /LENGTH=353 /DNA_ID=CAMNT_0005477929 /DNA_START=157 /DNA_END=1218 /DNA_ORIENTATION=-
MSRSILALTACLALLAAPALVAGALGDAGTAISTPVGSYTPSTSVAEQLEVSQTVSDINDNIGSSEYDLAKQAYLNNDYMVDIAKGQGLSGNVNQLFQDYYGRADFNDDYLINEAFAIGVEASKAEMVEKTVMDAIPFQAIVSLTQTSTSDANWDKAAALYLGNRALEASPYDRANKRGANFGTEVTGSDGTSQAMANQKILDAFKDKDFAEVLKQLKVVYGQAAIRYAHVLDNDLTASPKLPTDDHRAEGQAFYRIVAPFVKEYSTSCDSTMTSMYDLTAPTDDSGTYYCKALDCVVPALGIEDEVGTLEDTEGKCSGGGGGGTAQNKDSSASRLAAAFGAVVAAFVAAAFL